MRLPSGTTDQYAYFVARDATDNSTRETGLSSFTVYRVRNGGTATAWTTPTIAEVDATNMAGLYSLLVDEDTTIGAGNDEEQMVVHIEHAGMAPVDLEIELYRPKITEGNTLSVESDGDLTKVNTLDGHTAQTGDSYARLGAPAGASVSADIAAIEAQTDDIGVAGAGLTAIPWNSAWDAEVQSEVTDALNAYDPPTKTEMDSGFSGLNDPTAAAIADAVWDESTTGHTTAGTFGEQCKTDIDAILADTNELQTDDVPGLIGALNDVSSADVNAACDTALTDYDAPTKAEMDAGFAALNDFDPASETVDVGAIQGDSTSATNLAASTLGIVPASVNDAGATTTSFVTNLTETTDDHYIGRIIIFTSGDLANQATDITDYNGTTKAVTVTALTEAPANSVTFVIV